jgi:glucan-binding YG repeat protein
MMQKISQKDMQNMYLFGLNSYSMANLFQEYKNAKKPLFKDFAYSIANFRR